MKLGCVKQVPQKNNPNARGSWVGGEKEKTSKRSPDWEFGEVSGDRLESTQAKGREELQSIPVRRGGTNVVLRVRERVYQSSFKGDVWGWDNEGRRPV